MEKPQRKTFDLLIIDLSLFFFFFIAAAADDDVFTLSLQIFILSSLYTIKTTSAGEDLKKNPNTLKRS